MKKSRLLKTAKRKIFTLILIEIHRKMIDYF